MADRTTDALGSAMKSQQQASDLIAKLIDVAQPNAVFAAPLAVGDYTVVNVAEVYSGAGFGFGIGSGSGTQADEQGQTAPSEGSGGGGGGGGMTRSRGVAVISIGPSGVRVEPIVDVTAISLAMFTAMGTMFLMLRRMRGGR